MRHGAWKSKVFGQESGFTLIEALLAVVLIAIIATVAVSQYTDFTAESKSSATRESLALMRNAIQKHFSTFKLRCGYFTSNTGSGNYNYPSADTVNQNDITVGSNTPCNTAEVPAATDRYFIAGGLPMNPWSHPQCTDKEKSAVKGYSPINYINVDPGVQGYSGTYSGGTADGIPVKCGWIYDEKTGIIKAGTNYAGESAY